MRTLNHQREIKIGDKVRSHDFAFKFKDGTYDRIDLEGKFACYVEGVVIDIATAPIGQTCKMYHIKTTKKVFSGKILKDHEGEINYAPVNGTASFMGETFGVELVEEQEVQTALDKETGEPVTFEKFIELDN